MARSRAIAAVLEARRTAAEAQLAAVLAELAAAQAETRRCIAALGAAQAELDAVVQEIIIDDAQKRLRDEAARNGRRLSADAARAQARRDAQRAMALQSESSADEIVAAGQGDARSRRLPAAPEFRAEKPGPISSSLRSGGAAQAESSLSAAQLAGA